MAQMLSTRPIYDTQQVSARSHFYPEVEFYRRSDRRMSVALAHSPNLSDQYDSRRTSPSSEIDNKAGPAPRKRVPVACERCRKRKIKCSGNEPGKLACSNCHNAGHSNCHFLRVNSSNMGVYPLPSHNTRSFQQMERFSPYPTPSRSNYPASQPTYHNGVPYNSVHCGAEYQPYPSSAHPTSWSRASYAATYSMPFEEDTASPYPTQPPLFMLPPHADPMSSVNPYGSNSQINRMSQNGMWPDVPASNPHFVATTYALTPNVAASTFQPVSSPAISMHPTDRTLPTPSASRGLVSAPFSSVESLPMSAPSHRASNSWHADAISNADQPTRRTSYTMTQESSHRASESCTTQDIPFGYVVPSEPQETVQASSAGADAETLQPLRENRISASMNILNQEHQRRASHESVGSSPSSGSYGHTSASSGGRSSGHMSSSGHLINGQEYTRLPKARNDLLINDARLDCGVYQSNSANRTSVASISNSSSY